MSSSLGESTWRLLQLVVEQPWSALGMSVLVCSGFVCRQALYPDSIPFQHGEEGSTWV